MRIKGRPFVLMLPALIGCAGVFGGPGADVRDADSLAKSKKYTEAVATYQKVLREHPDTSQAADATFNLAVVLSSYDNPRRDYALALQEFEEFLKSYPDHKRAHEANNWRQALKTLMETIKDNERLKKNIEQLKRLDVRQEEKRSPKVRQHP